MLNVVDRITGDGTFRAFLARIRELNIPSVSGAASARRPTDEPWDVVSADGLWGSFAPILAGTAARSLQRPLLYVTAHLEQADEVRDDLELFIGQTPELLSAFETAAGEGAASDEIHAERLSLCAGLMELNDSAKGAPTGVNESRRADNLPPLIIVAPVQALMQAVPTPEAIAANTLILTVGRCHDPQDLVIWLTDHGYARLDQVESPGDFALRGDILDVYPPAETDPYRIDFFDDKIESIRQFDVSTQRSTREFETLRVAGMANMLNNSGSSTRKKPVRRRNVQDKGDDDMGATETCRPAITNFLSYMPPDTLVAFADPTEIQEIGRAFWSRLNAPTGMMRVERLFQRAASFTQLHLHPLRTPDRSETFSFDVRSLARFETRTEESLQELARLARERDVLLYCDNEAEQERFRELWLAQAGDWSIHLHPRLGLMHRGFDWPDGRIAVVGHHEVFHRYQQRRRIRKTHATRPIESWLDLTAGDFVVHVVHGIARFIGLRVIQKGRSNQSEEYLTLEFADGAQMHVPVTQIDLVQKYVGAGGAAPQLSKLGGTRWARTKERVEEAVSDLAAELLRLQAVRASQPGIAYPEDTPWQREFEGGFIYTETEDQLGAMAEIKRDMGKTIPMDRLLCGDVGYGKTELAIRAAFKAVEYGKQVALLVPTTVLAEQHERTFRERFADYPFIIESLSRFKTAKQQKEILDRARKGQIDIAIGTHRLLSKDVHFKDLGLLVIDEEQRFGVEHKEKLKRFRETVDVLTMSATPIPRTLHMSMVGIRDISALETPPMDRRSIVTRVTHWDEKLIREAIIREMNRDGQVFFVHNLVHDIQAFAAMVKAIVPEARLLIGHGQMHNRELERIMIDFIRHKADVLICTTIIESGLDIPNCNTIIIDQADRFGLSELHQLRGRVGRYKHRAYCYLILSRGKTLTANAARRLKAIEEFSDLGAGFRIAMRDLEIRGAGNMLGAEQSGHIAAIGYELYCQLLDAAVRRLRNEPLDDFRPVHLELDVPAHLPRSYVDSDRQRMEIYRRLARCRTPADLEQLDKDLRDAFGPYPPVVETLLQLAEIRILAQPYKIKIIAQKQPDLIFTIEEMALVETMLAHAPGSARMADAHTIHLRLTPAYFEPTTLLAVLRRMLRGELAPSTIGARP